MPTLGKSTEPENQLVVTRGWRELELEITIHGYGISLGGDENMF